MEIRVDFPFMLSLSKHEKLFFNGLLPPRALPTA
jgi:hypothetical protein